MTASRYAIEYDNDPGVDGVGFWEWWTIFDGYTKVCECPTEAMANRVVAALEFVDKATGQ